MENSAANYNRLMSFIAKHDLEDYEIYDCSGLPSRYLFDNGKVTAKRNCRHLGSMCTKVYTRKSGEDITGKLQPGDLLFRYSVYLHHVGVYVGDGLVVEVKGRDDGVVMHTMNANGNSYWNRYGRLKLFS